jgi:epoxide hydrolase-like predicted phosphatase
VRGLIVDYGGVLTSPLHDTMRAWCDADGIDLGHMRQVMRDWLGPAYTDAAVANPMHALERGQLTVPEFERQLATRLRRTDGRPVEPDGLLKRMFAGFAPQPTMFDVVRRAHVQGVRTALLSNSWGMDYPRDEWDKTFDAVVISGEVGMRKPEPEIYRLAAGRLGIPAAECVFVDDLPANVAGAVAVGMTGVRFTSADQAVAELEPLLGVDLR